MLLNPLVHRGDVVVVLRQVLTNLGNIGPVAFQSHRRWINDRSVWPLANFTLVGTGIVENGKKRLSVFSVSVMSFAVGLIPCVFRCEIVVVFLRRVGAIVAGFTKIFWKQLNAIWNHHAATHVSGSITGSVHSTNDRGASRCTNWIVRPSVIVDHALFCKRINVRRYCIWIAVATNLRPDIFGGQPQNVWSIIGQCFRRLQAAKQHQYKKGCT